MIYNLRVNKDWSDQDILKLQNAISELAEGLDTLYTETAPNGAISSRQGVIALYNTGGGYEMWLNTDGGTTWQKMASSSDLTNAVLLTGDQSVAGIKTFTSIPVLPASDPTTANQAVRKAFVDALFNTSTGHDHDGTDSKKVLATNLDPTGITDGHFLKNSGGAIVGEAIPTPGLLLVATNTITNQTGTVTSTFTVDSSKNYLIVWKSWATDGPGNPPGHYLDYVRFNSDTGTKYLYANDERYTEVHTQTTSGTETTQITAQEGWPATLFQATSGHFYLKFTSLVEAITFKVAYLSGESLCMTTGGGTPYNTKMNAPAFYKHFGMFSSATTDITSINLTFTTGGSELMSATIWLYELTQ